MPRKLKNQGFRVVIVDYHKTTPTKAWVEAQVVDGDFKEKPLKIDLAIEGTQTMSEIFQQADQTVKKAAGL